MKFLAAPALTATLPKAESDATFLATAKMWFPVNSTPASQSIESNATDFRPGERARTWNFGQ